MLRERHRVLSSVHMHLSIKNVLGETGQKTDPRQVSARLGFILIWKNMLKTHEVQRADHVPSKEKGTLHISYSCQKHEVVD